MKFFGSCLAACSLAFAASAALAAPPIDQASLLTKLHAINQAEIDAGKLAGDHGRSTDTKAYGAMLVADHQKADASVVKLATKNRIDLTPEAEAADFKDLKAKLAGLAAALRQAGPAEFDKVFADKMVEGHSDAIGLLQEAKKTLPHDADVQALTTELLPALELHKAEAVKLQTQQAAH